MGQEITHGDGAPRRGRTGEVFIDRVVEAELAVFDQHHYGRGSELFPYRAGLKNSFRFHRDVKLDVRHAVTLGLNHLPVAHDAKREPRNFLSAHFGSDVGVNFPCDFGSVRRRRLIPRSKRRRNRDDGEDAYQCARCRIDSDCSFQFCFAP